MRLHVSCLIVLALATAAGAQTIPLADWVVSSPETLSQPSWYGSTGLVYTPSAMITPPLKINGGVHRVDFDETQTVYNANVALASNIELGVARIQDVAPAFGATNQVYTNETIVNGKYKLDLSSWLGGIKAAPEIAVGVWDAADSVNRSFYLVASMDLDVAKVAGVSGLKAHIGFAESERATKNGDLKLGGMDGLFAGIEFVPVRNALLQVEYDTEDFNAALRYFPTPLVALEVGLIDGELGFGASARTPL